MSRFIVGRLNHTGQLHPSRDDTREKIYWGGLSFAGSPVIHSTEKKAAAEAEKLASMNPGAVFIVFSAGSAFYTATPPVVSEKL